MMENLNWRAEALKNIALMLTFLYELLLYKQEKVFNYYFTELWLLLIGNTI